MNPVQQFRFKQADLGVFNSNAKEVTDLLIKDCRLMGLTRGKFSLIDLIHEIIKKIGKSDIICCTWSAGIKDANQVKWMLDSDLINSFTLVTDHSYATRQQKYALAIEDLFGKENIRTSEIHAKFVLISNDDWKICIRTSMNLNANKTTETYELDDDKEIYDFYYNFIAHTFENMNGGFEPKSWKVNACVNDFFTKNEIEKDFSFWSNE